MSDTPLWVWQGFEGDWDDAAAGKAVTDALPPDVVGFHVPAAGKPPMPWNKAKTRAMWAVQVRPGNLLPTPAGCDEADPAWVGRLVGA